ncbi:MAG: hypothetical protein IPH07_24565 [Deltaproteobacteria bacterium]|nr:hypothetical protein [Deltaproteobacteria bacterium]
MTPRAPYHERIDRLRRALLSADLERAAAERRAHHAERALAAAQQASDPGPGVATARALAAGVVIVATLAGAYAVATVAALVLVFIFAWVTR